MRTIIYRTLSLTADLNVYMRNFTAARQAIADLERLQRNDADTYILKIRVLLHEALNDCANQPSLPDYGSKRQPMTNQSISMTVFSKR